MPSSLTPASSLLIISLASSLLSIYALASYFCNPSPAQSKSSKSKGTEKKAKPPVFTKLLDLLNHLKSHKSKVQPSSSSKSSSSGISSHLHIKQTLQSISTTHPDLLYKVFDIKTEPLQKLSFPTDSHIKTLIWETLHYEQNPFDDWDESHKPTFVELVDNLIPEKTKTKNTGITDYDIDTQSLLQARTPVKKRIIVGIKFTTILPLKSSIDRIKVASHIINTHFSKSENENEVPISEDVGFFCSCSHISKKGKGGECICPLSANMLQTFCGIRLVSKSTAYAVSRCEVGVIPPLFMNMNMNAGSEGGESVESVICGYINDNDVDNDNVGIDCVNNQTRVRVKHVLPTIMNASLKPNNNSSATSSLSSSLSSSSLLAGSDKYIVGGSGSKSHVLLLDLPSFSRISGVGYGDICKDSDDDGTSGIVGLGKAEAGYQLLEGHRRLNSRLNSNNAKAVTTKGKCLDDKGRGKGKEDEQSCISQKIEDLSTPYKSTTSPSKELIKYWSEILNFTAPRTVSGEFEWEKRLTGDLVRLAIRWKGGLRGVYDDLKCLVDFLVFVVDTDDEKDGQSKISKPSSSNADDDADADADADAEVIEGASEGSLKSRISKVLINAKDKHSKPPLHLACWKGDFISITALVYLARCILPTSSSFSSGAFIDSNSDDDNNDENGDGEKKQYDVNPVTLKQWLNQISTAPGNYGKTAVFYAITQCRSEVVQWLLKSLPSYLHLVSDDVSEDDKTKTDNETGSIGSIGEVMVRVCIVNNKGQSPRSMGVSHLTGSVCQLIEVCEIKEEKEFITNVKVGGRSVVDDGFGGCKGWTNYRHDCPDTFMSYGDIDPRYGLDVYNDPSASLRHDVQVYRELQTFLLPSLLPSHTGNDVNIDIGIGIDDRLINPVVCKGTSLWSRKGVNWRRIVGREDYDLDVSGRGRSGNDSGGSYIEKEDLYKDFDVYRGINSGEVVVVRDVKSAKIFENAVTELLSHNDKNANSVSVTVAMQAYYNHTRKNKDTEEKVKALEFSFSGISFLVDFYRVFSNSNTSRNRNSGYGEDVKNKNETEKTVIESLTRLFNPSVNPSAAINTMISSSESTNNNTQVKNTQVKNENTQVKTKVTLIGCGIQHDIQRLALSYPKITCFTEYHNCLELGEYIAANLSSSVKLLDMDMNMNMNSDDEVKIKINKAVTTYELISMVYKMKPFDKILKRKCKWEVVLGGLYLNDDGDGEDEGGINKNGNGNGKNVMNDWGEFGVAAYLFTGIYDKLFDKSSSSSSSSSSSNGDSEVKFLRNHRFTLFKPSKNVDVVGGASKLFHGWEIDNDENENPKGNDGSDDGDDGGNDDADGNDDVTGRNEDGILLARQVWGHSKKKPPHPTVKSTALRPDGYMTRNQINSKAKTKAKEYPVPLESIPLNIESLKVGSYCGKSKIDVVSFLLNLSSYDGTNSSDSGSTGSSIYTVPQYSPVTFDFKSGEIEISTGRLLLINANPWNRDNGRKGGGRSNKYDSKFERRFEGADNSGTGQRGIRFKFWEKKGQFMVGGKDYLFVKKGADSASINNTLPGNGGYLYCGEVKRRLPGDDDGDDNDALHNNGGGNSDYKTHAYKNSDRGSEKDRDSENGGGRWFDVVDWEVLEGTGFRGVVGLD